MTSKQPHHLVFGAGLIGGFVAGGLLNAGCRTAVVARPKTINAMQAGFLLTDLNDNSARVNAPEFVDSSVKSESATDFLWLTVKCTDVAKTLDDLARLMDDNTVLICCQNGLGSDAVIRERFPNNKIVGAIVGYNVAQPKPDHLHRSTDGTLVFENDPSIASIVELLNSPLMPCALSDNFVGNQWAKLQLNLGNPLGALSDVPIKAMLDQRWYRKVYAQLQRELLAVTNALNIQLPKLTPINPHWMPKLFDVPDFVFKLMSNKIVAVDPTARFSMWWDVHNNKLTEIDFINQAVVNAGQSVGVETPFNEKIVAMIHQLERGEIQRGVSAEAMWAMLSE